MKEKSKIKIEWLGISEITPYQRNTKVHPKDQIDKIANSISTFGFSQPIAVDKNKVIIAGHGRLEAAKALNMENVPCVILDLTEEEARVYRIADNRTNESEWEKDLLSFELGTIEREGLFDLSLTGFDFDELKELMLDDTESQNGKSESENSIKLSDKFLVPPLSVLDVRQGYWRQRKDQWLKLGIKSEEGRGENLLKMSDTMLQPDPEKRKKIKDREIQNNGAQAFNDNDKLKAYAHIKDLVLKGYSNEEAKKMCNEEPQKVFKILGIAPNTNGTSIFDPVLCELAYRWFSPAGGNVLDPFAGGSVRGITAALLGRYYYGGELRKEQVEANRLQADKICPGIKPVWACADSREIDKTFADKPIDLIFSCPPYADLEVYSDDPKDISTMDYKEFMTAYREIIAKSVSLLKPDRFAVFVIGEVREKNNGGFYKNFVPDTIKAFEDAGAKHYNEIVLLTPVGWLALRAGRTFSATRKIGKTHQNVIVFCKGDPKKATEACGEILIDNSIFDELSDEIETN
jgi:DNA modification methylase